MKLTGFRKREDRKGSVLLSIAVHVVVIALIASITFSYQFELFGPHETIPAERITYVKVQPQAAAPRGIGNGSEEKPKPKPKKAEQPAQLLAPSVTPTALPPVPPPSQSVGSVSGAPGGTGGAPAGIATGVEPAMPDSRILLVPNALRLPLTQAQKNDSAVKAIYLAYRQAEIETEANRGKSPRDWTFDCGRARHVVTSSGARIFAVVRDQAQRDAGTAHPH